MKQLLSLVLALSITTAYAQKYNLTDKEKVKLEKEIAKSKEKGSIVWDYDTIYKAGVPYCLMYEVKGGFLQNNSYSVRSLSGQELIYVKFVPSTGNSNAPNTPHTEAYYSYIFTDTKQSAETPTFSVYKEIVKNNLVDSGKKINSVAEAKFISTYGHKFSQPNQPLTNAGTANYTLVDRNKQGGIGIILGTIKQDGKAIGTIKYNETTANGVNAKTMDIFLANGTKAAEAVSNNSNHNWSITTFKDNMHSAVSSSGNDEMDVVKFLISGGYL